MSKYKIVKGHYYDGSEYFFIKKRFLFLWYCPDKVGCGVSPGDCSTTPRAYKTISDAEKTIEEIKKGKPKYRNETMRYYD